MIKGAYAGAGIDGVVSQNDLTVKWLNAYNAPHWMEIFSTDPETGLGLARNPSIPDWTSSQTGSPSTQPKKVERFGASWLRDLMVARQFASASFGVGGVGAQFPIFNGGGDANGGFTLGLHRSHSYGLALDLDINSYISKSRPDPPRNAKKDGNQYNTVESLVTLPPSNPLEWSNAQALTQTNALYETGDYRQTVNGVEKIGRAHV